MEPSDAVPPPERLEHHQSDWRLGVLHTVQYRCARTMSQKGDHESRVKRAEVYGISMPGTKRVIVAQIKVAEQLLHTTVHLTIFEKMSKRRARTAVL